MNLWVCCSISCSSGVMCVVSGVRFMYLFSLCSMCCVVVVGVCGMFIVGVLVCVFVGFVSCSVFCFLFLCSVGVSCVLWYLFVMFVFCVSVLVVCFVLGLSVACLWLCLCGVGRSCFGGRSRSRRWFL